jgi:pimeloyl-ACP methyl ester carboxylesterase
MMGDASAGASGPTVVLEMGAFFEPSPYWWGIQSEVARFARVCVYDRAGFGWSPPAAKAQTMEDRAADLYAVLSKAGVPGPYVLVGHSYGGPLIRLFARDHANLAAGFVFVDAPDEQSIFKPAYLTMLRRQMKPMFAALGGASRLGILRALSALAPGMSMIPEELPEDARRALAALQGPRALAAASAEADSILEAADRLGRAGFGGSLGDKPVAVITHGIPFPPPSDVLEDGWAEGQRRLTALSSDGELIVATKSNHMIQLDEPHIVVDAIRRVYAAVRDGTRLTGERGAVRASA